MTPLVFIVLKYTRGIENLPHMVEEPEGPDLKAREAMAKKMLIKPC